MLAHINMLCSSIALWNFTVNTIPFAWIGHFKAINWCDCEWKNMRMIVERVDVDKLAICPHIYISALRRCERTQLIKWKNAAASAYVPNHTQMPWNSPKGKIRCLISQHDWLLASKSINARIESISIGS